MPNLCLVLDASLQPWERDYFHALGSRLNAEVHFPVERPGNSRLNPRPHMWFVSRWWRDWAKHYASPGVYFTPMGPYKGTINFFHHLFRSWMRGEAAAQVLTHCDLSRRFFLEVEGRQSGQVGFLELPYLVSGVSITNAKSTAPGELRVGVLCDFDAESNFGAIVSVAHAVHGQNPKIKFHLRGHGPLTSHSLAQVRDLGLNQVIVFENSNAPFPCDALLHLPIRSEHLIPVFQAGHVSIPVVAHDLPGLGRLVRDGQSGFVVPVHNTDAAARALLRLAQDVGLRNQMGRELHAACQHLKAVSEIERKIIEFFDGGVDSPRAA